MPKKEVPLTKAQLVTLRGLLDDKVAEITRGLEIHLREVRIEGTNDDGERTVAYAARETSVTIIRGNEKILAAVIAALDKMQTGEYGLCEDCERPISYIRLKAVPWASHCIACKKEKKPPAQRKPTTPTPASRPLPSLPSPGIRTESTIFNYIGGRVTSITIWWPPWPAEKEKND